MAVPYRLKNSNTARSVVVRLVNSVNKGLNMAENRETRNPAIEPNATEPIESTEARRLLGYLINRVEFGKERILITRRGRAVASLVPVEDAVESAPEIAA